MEYFAEDIIRARYNTYQAAVLQFRRYTCLPIASGSNAIHLLHLKLLLEETVELQLARTLADKADALADCVVVLLGYDIDAGEFAQIDVMQYLRNFEALAADVGIDLPGAFTIVHESNMLKTVRSDKEKHDTEDKYRPQNVVIEWREPSPGIWAAFAAEETSAFPKGKLLKPAGWQPPNWARANEYILS